MTGDFNARTGDLSDMGLDAEGLENLNHPKNWKVSDSFPIHLNCDRTSPGMHTNSYGKDLIDMCKACSLGILRRMEDTTGNFTRMGTTGNSVVDYCLVDDAAANIVSSVCVLHRIPESDHRPLAIKLSNFKADIRNYESGAKYYKISGIMLI